MEALPVQALERKHAGTPLLVEGRFARRRRNKLESALCFQPESLEVAPNRTQIELFINFSLKN